MKNRTHTAAAISVLCLTLLSACGGGGGDSPAPPGGGGNPTTPYALNAGYTARIAAGSTDNFTVGGCGGTVTFTAQVPVSVTTPFEGRTDRLQSTQSQTAMLTGCTFSPVNGTAYYSLGFLPIGVQFSFAGGTEYARLDAEPMAIPTTVRVGDTGTISILTSYTDSTKTGPPLGKRKITYAIEADGNSSNTAIAVITNGVYDNNDQLQATQKTRYRMTENVNTLTLLTIEFASVGRPTLLFTKT